MKEKDRQAMYRRISYHGSLLKDFCKIDGDPIALCKKLHRIERKAHNLMLDYCNGVMDHDTLEKGAEKIEKQVKKILGMDIYLNRDPRGRSLKFTEEQSVSWTGYKDLGGYGIIAPDLTEGGYRVQGL